MPIDLPPPTKLWTPSRPAIIRSASLDDAKLAMPLVTMFGALSARGFQSAAAASGNDEFTVALLHFDGSDGATSFPDTNAGGSAKTWTAAGNAQIDTAQSVFGGGSLLLDGAGDYISTADHADFEFGNSEFTIDLRVRFAALPTGTIGSGNGMFFVSHWTNASRAWVFGVGFNGTNYNLGFLYNSTTALSSAIALSTGVWYHVAVVRDNTGTDTLRFFLNGAANGTDTGINGVTVADSTDVISIGASSTGHSYANAWFDELRISNGAARWTSAFTPPSSPYAT